MTLSLPLSAQTVSRLELVIGLVYGAGVVVDPLQELLRDHLEPFGYQTKPLRFSDWFPTVVGAEHSKDSPSATRRLQNLGDTIRERTTDKAFIARLAVMLIADARSQLDPPPERLAWIVRSLRRKEEVRYLRGVYGPRFIVLGIHASESVRLRNLIEDRKHAASTTSASFEAAATEDLRRDERDASNPYGQSMREAFAEADFVIDASTEPELKFTISRSVGIVFGEPFATPTRNEQAMYHAYSAGLQSAEMGRQVGAALVSTEGDLLAVGTNEVPTGGGGVYHDLGQPDGRDFAQTRPVDSNTEWRRRVARELLRRLSEAPDASDPKSTPWLDDSRVRKMGEEIVVEEDDLNDFLRYVDNTRFSDLIEFGRAVHAEMDALLCAARNGVTLRGCTLVCTTFPCHNCTRHLIAAGVRRVMYLYPYAKSLAQELHSDAIAFDPVDPAVVSANKLIMAQFVGVTPRGFAQYFDFSRVKRKDDETGRALRLTHRRSIEPRVIRDQDTWSFGGPPLHPDTIAELERTSLTETAALLKQANLHFPTQSLEEVMNDGTEQEDAG